MNSQFKFDLKNYKSRYSRYAPPRKSGLQGLRQDDSDDPTRSADLDKHQGQPYILISHRP